MSHITIKSSAGDIKIKLLTDIAPKTCERVRALVRGAHYDGCCFYRAEPNFVIQGGLRMPDGAKKPTPFAEGVPLEYHRLNKRSTVTMARWEATDSATGEFFINLKDNSNLDRTGDSGWALGFAVWGEVVSGMDVADAISGHATKSANGMKMLVEPIVYTMQLTD